MYSIREAGCCSKRKIIVSKFLSYGRGSLLGRENLLQLLIETKYSLALKYLDHVDFFKFLGTITLQTYLRIIKRNFES